MYILDDYVINETTPNKEWYYHAFMYNKLIPIYEKGILCPKDLGKKGDGHNGPYYVSVAKQDLFPNSIYRQFAYGGFPMFILNDLNPLETHDNEFARSIEKTIIPYRYSPHETEYQIYRKVDPTHIIGIRSMSLNNKYDLMDLKQMLMEMKLHDIDLPLYDYSFEKSNIIRELDKEKILKKL